MRKNRKRIAVLSMAAVMALGMSVTALAKDDTKEVKRSLRLEIPWIFQVTQSATIRKASDTK